MATILISRSNQTLFKYLCQDLQNICLVQEKDTQKVKWKKFKNCIGFLLSHLYQDALNNKKRDFEKYVS